MMLSTSIRSWFRDRIEWTKTNPLLTFLCSLLIVLFSAFTAVMFSSTAEESIGRLLGLGLSGQNEKNKILAFLGIGMGGILLAVQAVIANRRAKAMEETAKAQAKATEEQAKANQNTEQGQRQERLKNAIEHLGHASDSVRLGGAYELFHLAQDTKDLRQTVLDILCAHIRQTTGKREYREKHKAEPSEEVQSLLTLLFVQDHKVFKGCHINLQGCWLNGTDLQRAYLKNAVLTQTHLYEADLSEASLQLANLRETHLEKAVLKKAHLQGVNLSEAHMHEASLAETHLHGANLYSADLRLADLAKVHLMGAKLLYTRLQGAFLDHAQLQGADLSEARLEAANLLYAHLQGAILNRAHLQGTILLYAELRGARGFTGGEAWLSTLQLSFLERIKEAVGKESDLSGVTFTGGLNQEYVDAITKDLPDPQTRELQVNLQLHINRIPDNQLPENSGAITGTYTKEEAEEWIAEYDEAMSEVPKEDAD